MSESIKKFTPFDKGIKLVSRPSDLDPFDNDPGVLRAELSCGHITGPETLTDCCRAQLHCTEFRCPVCDEEWRYDEVRKLAKLTVDEQSEFEKKLGMNTVETLVDFRDCPGCGTFTERSDVSNLCVECSVCTMKNRRTYEFCWKCMRVWKGPRPRADQCGNVGCSFADQEVLRECPMITITYNKNYMQCPKVRACPTCGLLIEHKRGCHNMRCNTCNNYFCFVCLQLGHYDQLCNLAPRQISSNNI